MDKFIVSARKYRPQNFSTVVGQEHITTTLKNAISNNQLAHSFLFCGPRGVGKTTCARILAKTINCTNKTADGEACNQCNSCVVFDNGSSLNIHELDAASNNSVDDIRALTEQVRFVPQAGDYKVYIIDEVHMLSQAAFNAFLKTLEEPPAYAIFILATTEKHKILPTILSRCQIFDFKRITTEDTVAHLQEICSKETIEAEKTALHVIAQKSEGCLRDSLSILDKIASFTGNHITYNNTLEHLNILDEDYYFKMLTHLQEQNIADALLLFDEICQKGFEPDTFLDGCMEFLRNVLVSTDARVASLLDVAEEFKIKYTGAAQSIAINWMVAALNLLTETAIGYKMSRNKKLHVELVLIKLAYLQQAISITGGEAQVKKKLTNPSAVQFKAIAPVLAPPLRPAKKEQTQEAAVYIQQPKKEAGAKVATVASTASAQPAVLGSLQKIQKQIARQNKIALQPEALTTEALKTELHAIAETLKENGKEITATHLVQADVEIKNDSEFVFKVLSPINAKFLAAERATISKALQARFNNSKLKYSVESEAKSTAETQQNNADIKSKKEQYQALIKKYPLVAELKDRLGLSMD